MIQERGNIEVTLREDHPGLPADPTKGQRSRFRRLSQSFFIRNHANMVEIGKGLKANTMQLFKETTEDEFILKAKFFRDGKR